MIDEYRAFLTQLFGDPAFASALASAAARHHRIEQDFRRQLAEACPAIHIRFPNIELPAPEYLSKNLFSIFLVSILESLGVPEDRLHAYGVLVHAIRGVVTATDNIVDGEDKGTLHIDMGQSRIAPNVLLLLLQDGIIHQTIAALSGDAALRSRAWQSLMAIVLDILREESGEESAITAALTPEDLLATIHSFRGGRLFQLGFVIPEVIEQERSAAIALLKEGVFGFGLAIQMLDDLADLAEDVAARNHNLLRSWIVHRHADGAWDDAALLAADPADLAAPELRFPASTRAVVREAAATAARGFAALRAQGYPIGPQAEQRFLALLFRIRGVERLLPLAA